MEAGASAHEHARVIAHAIAALHCGPTLSSSLAAPVDLHKGSLKDCSAGNERMHDVIALLTLPELAQALQPLKACETAALQIQMLGILGKLRDICRHIAD